MAPDKTHPCPVCGSPLRFETRAKRLSYKGATATVDLPGWWCRSCGEGILEGKALALHERAYMTLKASVDQVMTPAEVTEIREKLGLTKQRAGEILGGGIKAFQKYESGKGAVSLPMTNLLWLLKSAPELLKKLPAYTTPGGSVEKKTVAHAATRRKAKRATPKRKAQGATPRRRTRR